MTTFSNGEQRNSIRTKINASITTTDAMDQGVATTDSPTFVDVSVTGTVDGRDVAADGTKLDGIEAGADVTDTANVTAAGALMDSEVTNLAAVKAFDPTDYATAAQGTKADTAHGWGDHSTAGYAASSHTHTLSQITDAGTAAASATTDFATAAQGTLADSAVQPNDSPSFGSITADGLTVDTDTLYVDSTNNRVGIGTSSPNEKLHVSGNMTVGDTANAYGEIRFNNSTITGTTRIRQLNNDGLLFFHNNSETMRVDSSGNLLVGTTDTSPHDSSTEEGLALRQDVGGFLGVSRSGGYTSAFNRMSTDGDIVQFRKDGTTVGIIGNNGSDLYLVRNGGAGIGFYSSGFAPASGVGSWIDNAYDIGSSTVRWDDVYATNGTIQTSDENEKQDIAELDEAEKRVATACKGLIRKFRWKDAVEEKGDDARIHVGIIAQDLQAAFAAEGLDAGRYAMFISTTWWETETEVPAVEAVDEVLDEDGNVVTEAVEAQEAYTRTDTYETAEEAPEGATERTRMGVRYPELLAFIIGAI